MYATKGYSRHVVTCVSSSKPPLAKKIVRAIAVGTALTGSCIISFPYLLRSKAGLAYFTTVVSSLHPKVGLQLERADIGWFAKKPTLEGLAVYDKTSQNRKIFSARTIRGSRSLFDVMLRHRDADVFVEKPTVVLTEAIRSASSLEADQRASNAFSGEFNIDDRIHIYISDGSLDLTETVCAMLDGRLFIDATDVHGQVVVDVEAPGFQAKVQGTRQIAASPSLLVSLPIHVEAKVTKSLADVLLKRINPLLVGSMDIHSQSVITCEVQPETGILPSDIMRVDISGYTLNVKQGKVVKDLLRVVSTFSPDLKRTLSKDVELSVTSSHAHVIVDQASGTTTTDIEKISIDIPGYQHRLDLGVSGKTTGVLPHDAIDMNLSISAQTLENIFGIRGGPLVLRVKGSSTQPHILVQKAIIDLGLLVAENL